MDRKAGYKECPRCGLRNKPSALQCDFCGLRFIAGEDWDENIQALEKMGGNEEKVQVDEDISKRIEATIVKREKINAPSKTKESEKDDFDYFKKEPEPINTAPAPVVAPSKEAAKSSVVEPSQEPQPVIVAAEPIRASPSPVQSPPEPERIVITERRSVEEKPEPVMQEPEKEKKLVRRVERPKKQANVPLKSSKRKTTFTAVLLLGVISYILAIMFGDGSLGRAGGWILVTISTVMVVAGAVELFVPRAEGKMIFADGPSQEKQPQEVLICPKCHEMVSASDRICPDCGAEFGKE
jgi:hypothetical protein